MKRKSKGKSHENDNNADSMVILPPEILMLISKNVQDVCFKLSDFFRWHSTCRTYWHEFSTMEDEKLLLFITQKKEKNHLFFSKTLQSQYKDNLIEFFNYEKIIRICMTAKERIQGLSQKESIIFDPTFVFTKTGSFSLKLWNNWNGMHFDEDELLIKLSLSILRVSTMILRNRIQWEIVFLDQKKEGKRRHFRFPWQNEDNQPILKEYSSYLSNAQVIDPDIEFEYYF